MYLVLSQVHEYLHQSSTRVPTRSGVRLVDHRFSFKITTLEYVLYRCSLRVRTHSGSDVKSCLYQNTIHGGGRVEQRIHTPRKRVAWMKLRKERKKFSKLLIFSTDCSQPVGLQSVIKIRGKTSKLFALHASPYKGSVFTSDPECLEKERHAAVFNLKKNK